MQTYKQTPSDREAILDSQGRKCALCDRPFGNGPEEYMAFQDHDHKCCPRKQKQFCGKCNRGLLCFICNKKVIALLERIEKMNENHPEYKISIEKALAYIRDWNIALTLRGAYAAKKKEKRLRKK